MDIIFPESITNTKPWGTEIWSISAHSSSDCNVNNTKLSKIFPSFPLLVKVIFVDDKTSIQVHPDEKSECWYVLECEPNAEFLLGHRAKNKQEFEESVKNELWEELLRKVPVNKGDLIQIDPGTVHSFSGKCVLLETQQSSDITYRVYDYGSTRELHLKKAIETINFPNKSIHIRNFDNDNSLKILENDRYTIYKINVEGICDLKNNYEFINFTVIEGSGKVNNIDIKQYDSFIVPQDVKNISLTGTMKLIASRV